MNRLSVPVRNLLSIPVIYSMCVPLFALDLWVSLYQAVCFPLYGIATVRRRDYFVIDRARLPYLNVVEKVHCAYCGYANGVLSFAREIAARTEQYWCPIKHDRLPKAVHERYSRFLEYGDGVHFESRAQALRSSLTEEARQACR